MFIYSKLYEDLIKFLHYICELRTALMITNACLEINYVYENVLEELIM